MNNLKQFPFVVNISINIAQNLLLIQTKAQTQEKKKRIFLKATHDNSGFFQIKCLICA